MEPILNAALPINIFFQNLGTWMKVPMDFFSSLGSAYFFLLILPSLYWCFETRVGLRVGIMLLVSLSFNDALKMAFHMPRPYWVSSQVHGYALEESFGLPSGHSQNSAAIWGMLAAMLRKRWAWGIAIFVVLAIGISRLYLGVHFIYDVLLGWLVGAILLFLVLKFWNPVEAWARKLTLGRQILAAFLFSFGFFLLSFVSFLWMTLSGWQAPEQWATYATKAISLEGALLSGGVFFGLLAGLAWFNHQGGFSTDGPIWKRCLRFIVGAVGIAFIYFGLKQSFALIVTENSGVIADLLYYIRYALVGAWVSAGAPWCFIKLRLAEKSH